LAVLFFAAFLTGDFAAGRFAAAFFAVFFAGVASPATGWRMRAVRVFSASAAVSSASNSAGLIGRADLRSRSMS
jgi:hypothetical protein